MVNLRACTNLVKLFLLRHSAESSLLQPSSGLGLATTLNLAWQLGIWKQVEKLVTEGGLKLQLIQKRQTNELVSLTGQQLIGKIRLLGAVPWGTKKFQAVPGSTIRLNICSPLRGDISKEMLLTTPSVLWSH